MPSIYDELAAMAEDPSTDWDTLHWIVEHHPELRPAVAENPSTYSELVQALAGLQDPAIDAALARRWARESPPARPAAPVHSEAPAPQRVPVRPTVPVTQRQPYPSDDDAPARPRRVSRAPKLILAVALPLVALAAVAALLLNLWAGSDDAGDPSAGTIAAEAASPEAETQPSAPGDSDPDAVATGEPTAESTAAPTEDELRAAVAALPEESSCEAPEEDRAALIDFGAAVAGEDPVWGEPADASLVEETLMALQESCTSSHAARVYLDLQGSVEEVPTALRATVESMGPAWIRTAFPAQGQPLESFAAPGGNVVCELGNALRCTVLQHSFSAPEGCIGGATYAIEVDRPAEPACGDPVEPVGQPVLGYGQTASNEFFACSSFQSQMSCWNQLTGEGINLSPSRNATY